MTCLICYELVKLLDWHAEEFVRHNEMLLTSIVLLARNMIVELAVKNVFGEWIRHIYIYIYIYIISHVILCYFTIRKSSTTKQKPYFVGRTLGRLRGRSNGFTLSLA